MIDPEKIAEKLCKSLGLDPSAMIERGCDRRFINYEGEYYINWARDQVELIGLLVNAIGSENE